MVFCNVFPFPVEVWGTVSDWAAVLVYGITGFLIFKTLKSQQVVQQTQYELYKIERIRFTESIKPIFRYIASTEIMTSSDEGKRILTIKVTNETNSLAKEISKIVSENSKQTRQIFIPTGYSDIRKHLVKGDAPLLFHFLIESNSRLSDFVVFSLKYQDIEGTNYKQNIVCICDNFGIEIHPALPEIIVD